MKSRLLLSGTTLLELLISISIGSLLTVILVLLFSRSQFFFRSESSRSGQFRELAKGMRLLSDKLSQGSVYLVGPLDKILSPEGFSEIEIEQFQEMYHAHQLLKLSIRNQELIEEDYPLPETTMILHHLEKPRQKVVLAKSIKEVRFRLVSFNTLEITLNGEKFSLQTEIPGIKLSLAASQ